MKCKHCGRKLPKGSTICISCGGKIKNPVEKKPMKPGGIALAVVSGVVALGVIVMAVLWAAGILWPRDNDIYNKDNYTVWDLFMGDRMSDVIAYVEDEPLTNAQLNVFYWMQIYNYGSAYDIDYSKPLSWQVMDEDTGMTWQQYLIESALTTWKQYQKVTLMAEAAGFELPKEYQNSITSLEAEARSSAKENGFKTVNEMFAEDFGKGVTMDEYSRFFYLYYMANLYYEELKSKMEPTDAQKDAYFESLEEELVTEWDVKVTKDIGLLVDVRHILIQPPNGKVVDGQFVFTEEDWAAGLAEAQQIYDEWLSGGGSEEEFAQAAYINSVDSNSTDGGLYVDVSRDVMVDAFEEWCFDESRQPGDHGIVKTPYGYHIMYFVGSEDGWDRYCGAGALEMIAMEYIEELMTSTKMDTDYTKLVLADIDLMKN